MKQEVAPCALLPRVHRYFRLVFFPCTSTDRTEVLFAASGSGVAEETVAVLRQAMAESRCVRIDYYSESGVVHFTDDLSSVPEKQRGRVKDILKTPPPAGKPGLSTIGDTAPRSPAAPGTWSPGNGGGAYPAPSTEDSLESQAEQLRAKIAAKEQFINRIDTKRSHMLNPLGNRFVSKEDLELYRKYSGELPGDRERLREIESRLSPGVN